MAKQKNTRVRVASSDVAVGTSVHAPSAVNAQSKSAQNAALLSSALGFGGEQFEAFAKKRHTKQAEEGAIAVTHGMSIEQLRAAKQTAGFVYGAERALAKQKVIEDSIAANDFYQTEIDKGSTPQEIREALNGFWANRYEGVDSVIGRLVVPKIAETNNRILDKHAEFQTKEVQKSLLEAQGTILTDIIAGGELTKATWDTWREESNRILGKQATLSNAVSTISQIAAEAEDERIWDAPEFAHLRNNRQFREEIETSYLNAKSARVENTRINGTQAMLDIREEWEVELGSGGWLTQDELMNAQKFTERDSNDKQRLTDAQYMSLWTRSIANRLEAAGNLEGGRINFNNPVWATTVDADMTDRDIQKEFDRQQDVVLTAPDEAFGPDLDPQQIMQKKVNGIVDASNESGMMYRPWKRQLQLRASTPEQLEANVGIFDLINSSNPAVARDYAGAEYARLSTASDLMKRTENSPEARNDAIAQFVTSDFKDKVDRISRQDGEYDDFVGLLEVESGDVRNFDAMAKDAENLAYQFMRQDVPREEAMARAAKITNDGYEQVGEYWLPNTHIVPGGEEYLEDAFDFLMDKAIDYENEFSGVSLRRKDLVVVPVDGARSYEYEIRDRTSGESYPISENQSNFDVRSVQEAWMMHNSATQQENFRKEEARKKRVRGEKINQAAGMIRVYQPSISHEDAMAAATDMIDAQEQTGGEVAQAITSFAKSAIDAFAEQGLRQAEMAQNGIFIPTF